MVYGKYSFDMTGVLGWYRKMRYRPEEERESKKTQGVISGGIEEIAANTLSYFDTTFEQGYFLRVSDGNGGRNPRHFEEFYPINVIGGNSRADLPASLVIRIGNLDHLALFNPPERKPKPKGPGLQDYHDVEMKYEDGNPIFVRYEAVRDGGEVYDHILKALAFSKK